MKYKIKFIFVIFINNEEICRSINSFADQASVTSNIEIAKPQKQVSAHFFYRITQKSSTKCGPIHHEPSRIERKYNKKH